MEVDKQEKSEAVPSEAKNESELIKSAKLEDEEEFEEFPVYNKGEGIDTGEAQAAINVWEEELKKCGYKLIRVICFLFSAQLFE
ncbi:hypothetical protein niasHT_022777 [Heterodera trifolii]|uniref:Uncharacterized protein n=1 Tax=Heterodera trifolii TaxID=157864 RepID=A0ABD2KPD2_9BILA